MSARSTTCARPPSTAGQSRRTCCGECWQAEAELHPRATDLIRTLHLAPHPEGGHYGEVFRSTLEVRVSGRDVSRRALTSIYFLLAAGEQSRWHRVMADEAWHFYEGDPLELLWLNEAGNDRALVGCSVRPGFEFADFALLADHASEAEALRRRFPDLAALL